MLLFAKWRSKAFSQSNDRSHTMNFAVSAMVLRSSSIFRLSWVFSVLNGLVGSMLVESLDFGSGALRSFMRSHMIVPQCSYVWRSYKEDRYKRSTRTNLKTKQTIKTNKNAIPVDNGRLSREHTHQWIDEQATIKLITAFGHDDFGGGRPQCGHMQRKYHSTIPVALDGRSAKLLFIELTYDKWLIASSSTIKTLRNFPFKVRIPKVVWKQNNEPTK